MKVMFIPYKCKIHKDNILKEFVETISHCSYFSVHKHLIYMQPHLRKSIQVIKCIRAMNNQDIAIYPQVSDIQTVTLFPLN